MSCVVAPLLLPVVLAAPLRAQTARAAQTHAALEARVDSIFADYNHTDSPGCAVGVYRDGAIAYARGYGMADLEQNVAIDARTVFDIGSTSKQFTATALVLLAHDGLLSLDDDVRRYIPELPDYGAPITIRHLLNHTSGLRDYIGLMTMGGTDIDDVTGDDEALAAITRQRALNFEPGAEWLYSNSGYFLASVIVKRVAGKSLPDFAHERIFAPLGMRHTRFRDDYRLVIPHRASAYAPTSTGYVIDMSSWQQVGDGAVFTTVEDLLLWDRNWYEPVVGGQRLLGDLQTRGLLSGGDTLSYALGVFLDEYRGQRTVSHGGSWGGYRAELLRFPDQHFSVAVLCNLATTNPTALAQRVADVYLDERLAAPARASTADAADDRAPVVLSAAQLRRFAGTFWDRAGGEVRRVQLQDSALALEAFGREWKLQPVAADELVIADAPVDVRFRLEAGNTDRLVQTLQGRTTAFERVEVVVPTAAELRALAGRFFSPELAATYEVRLDGDTLVLVQPNEPEPLVLQPLQRDVFHGGGMSIRFQRTGDSIAGFLLDRGRVRGLVFERSTDQQLR